jgi:polyisoprenyl-phosphate glycosyltransferase
MSRPLLFVIPVYFDAPSFVRLRSRILSCLPQGFAPEFFLLDDSAGEDSALARLRYPDTQLLRMPRNFGHQRALVQGLRAILREAPADALLVTMDADGEDRPEDLPRLIETFLREGESSIVLAWRTTRKEGVAFRCCYFFYRQLFRMLTGTVVRSGNYALFTASAMRELISHPDFRFAYASTLLAVGRGVTFVPCPRGERYEGSSKMGFLRLAAHGLRMLLPFRGRILKRTAVFAFTFGLALVPLLR